MDVTTFKNRADINYRDHMADEESFFKLLEFALPGIFTPTHRHCSWDFEAKDKRIMVEYKRVHRASDSVEHFFLPLCKYIVLEGLIDEGNTVFYVLEFDDSIKCCELSIGLAESCTIKRYAYTTNLLVPSIEFTDSIHELLSRQELKLDRSPGYLKMLDLYRQLERFNTTK